MSVCSRLVWSDLYTVALPTEFEGFRRHLRSVLAIVRGGATLADGRDCRIYFEQWVDLNNLPSGAKEAAEKLSE
jgi:hypothetical protein